jgi:uncharacterized membrane protein
MILFYFLPVLNIFRFKLILNNMKKLLVFSLLVATAAIFSYCGSSKKAAGATETKKAATVYAANVETTVMNKCAPCHIPSKGGRLKALDTYASVRDNIDEIIRRIQLNPTDKGFMPAKNPKLDDATIAIFKQWKADGSLEK